MNFPEKIELNKGINLYLIKTDKFKTFQINVFIHRPLDDKATMNALIPLVLRRGTQKLKTSKEISTYLEELYGAIFDCGVAKKGERHILRFQVECINDRFADQNLFNKSLEFIKDIIYNPLLENNSFKEEYFNQEKEILKKIIEGKVNDKMQYAMTRLTEEMCKDEAYSIYEYGNLEDLEKINSKDLFGYYSEIIKNSPVDIFISGDIKDDEEASVEEAFKVEKGQVINIPETVIEKKVTEAKNIEDKMDVSQGKICIGFRTNTSYNSEDYFKLMLYSAILGGGITSKLFMNVREKASLAYTIFSRIDKFKGIMMIAGGIEVDKFEKAKEIIFKQLDDMKNGNITDEEYSSAVKTLTTSITSLKDSHLYLADFFLSQQISNSKHTIEDVLKHINEVKKEDVPKVAEKIKLDTVYFLRDKQQQKEGSINAD